MASEDSALRKRDIFASPLFSGLSHAEHVQIIVDALRYLPDAPKTMCVENGCEAFAEYGIRCDMHRKLKAAQASRAHYAKVGRKR